MELISTSPPAAIPVRSLSYLLSFLLCYCPSFFFLATSLLSVFSLVCKLHFRERAPIKSTSITTSHDTPRKSDVNFFQLFALSKQLQRGTKEILKHSETFSKLFFLFHDAVASFKKEMRGKLLYIIYTPFNVEEKRKEKKMTRCDRKLYR